MELYSTARSKVEKPLAFQDRTNSDSTIMQMCPHELFNVSTAIAGVATKQVDDHASASPYPLRMTNGKNEEHRRWRYSTAEAELVRQFRKSQTELSPRELQIRALEQATTVLSAHAQDARERADRLRQLLEDRDTDPVVYETLKRERWLEESRQFAVEQERKVVRQNLEMLTNLSSHGGTEVLSASLGDAQTADEARRRRNLLKFLDSSSTHPPVRVRKATSLIFERSSKRRTLDRVTPMRLRTESTGSDASFRFQHLRPISDGWAPPARHAFKSRDDVSQGPRSAPILPSLAAVAEDQTTSTDGMAQPTEPASSSGLYFAEPSKPASFAFAGTPFPPKSRSRHSRRKSDYGTATIFASAAPSLTDIHIDAADVDAPLPDYALDLFSRFECGLPISMSDSELPPTPLPTRSSDVGPPEAEPQYDPLPTRHSSSSLQVPSFTPQKQRRSKTSILRRSGSGRQVGSLVSIPESSSSSEKRAQREEEGPPSKVSSAASLALPTASRGGSKEGREDLTSKIKRRFSVLRIGGRS
ncbi:hypothetical protein LshimejAT787_1802050 [Lyophyllum shimeji]|uniref:Uncharacterized protein n=1 Tax=Lyophyllum shimeji TaxID=47721 RepID=A0A9P3Q0F2_LYOSH|nr:hypothetical protein LshimejAT787_1802050 [Lyophyllum shimeji]